MTKETGIELDALNVDGGASANNLLMQFQADINGKAVNRPHILETTALGAAYLAGLAVKFWKDTDEITQKRGEGKRFEPQMEKENVQKYLSDWHKAVKRSLRWEAEDEM